MLTKCSGLNVRFIKSKVILERFGSPRRMPANTCIENIIPINKWSIMLHRRVDQPLNAPIPRLSPSVLQSNPDACLASPYRWYCHPLQNRKFLPRVESARIQPIGFVGCWIKPSTRLPSQANLKSKAVDEPRYRWGIISVQSGVAYAPRGSCLMLINASTTRNILANAWATPQIEHSVPRTR